MTMTAELAELLAFFDKPEAIGIIYKLNFASGKSYIGMTTRTLVIRMRMHRNALTRPKNANRLVYNAWRKHGAPIATVLMTAPIVELASHEIRLIAEHNTFGDGGYNLTAGGEATLGYRHTEESRLKMHLTHIGIPAPHNCRPCSEEKKKKISDTKRNSPVGLRVAAEKKLKKENPKPHGNKGKVHSAEQNTRNGELKRGVKQSEATKAKRGTTLRATLEKRKLLQATV